MSDEIILDGQAYVRLQNPEHIAFLKKQPLIAFAVRLDGKGGYETVPGVMYAGKLDVIRRRSRPDVESYALYGAVRYELQAGEWVSQNTKHVVGLSPDELEARAVHCPKFLYTEGVI